MDIIKKVMGILMILMVLASSAMAQGFDPATEATSATTIVGTVFGIVFATIISIVIGLKVIKYIRGT